MMNLSANMDLKNIKDNILAKANNGNELFYPPDKLEAMQNLEAIQMKL